MSETAAMDPTDQYQATVFTAMDVAQPQRLGVLTNDGYITATGNLNTIPGVAWNSPLTTTAGNYPLGIGQGIPQTTGYADVAALPTASYHRCHGNQHYFECRHESLCECGRTQRLMDTSLTEGL